MCDDEVGLRPVRRVVFSLGSNIDDRLEHLWLGVSTLRRTPLTRLVGVSPVYETVAVGDPQPDFLNAVVVMDSTLPSLVLLERAQAIEAALGRPADHEPGPRTLDVDLIVVGDRVLQTERLTLPHPRAHERAFVLFPWLDVEPDAVLPGRGAVRDLADAVTDEGIRVVPEVIVP
ncbi:2-amino-4-hydroxy-6-hydroxymethyldihydropteridine diphosphokinase [Propionicicella superfundia]|uniref:2-amino-4-hydroxy-6- hydroxymethyldihydropteridine diphosphokinase n=1 Tax=Propionicicella superfundia TaxID=348582 RepID=UPI00041FAA10|nr:2-amino-4-hydroxy-6-hydroxymethyldihydropteridine diphosphokinase [Propionicicella superfundia]